MHQPPAPQAARPLARLARLFTRTPDAKASAAGPLIAMQTGRGEPVWTPRDYATFAREGVMQNAIVYRAVRMISECAASVPLLLYERDRELSEHPLLTLLDRPSPGTTGTDLIESFLGYLLVSGNGYIEAAGIAGELRELHALRPDRMKVIPGPDGWPEAFEYSAGGQKVRIAGEPAPGVRAVLHMKLFHPANDHYGLSPIEPAATAIDLHNAAARWNKALLDNSARPSGALVYSNGQHMTAEQFERLKGELEASFQGTRNAGRPLLLEGGLDWKAMSLTPRDLDFIEAKHAAAREIALAIGVPPMLLGIPGDNTYANYAEANRAFWRQTVLPLVQRTARALTLWLTPAYGGGLRFSPDLDQVEALSPERDALWKRLEATSFLTQAEKRAAIGYSNTEGGDSAARPFLAKYNPDQQRIPAGNGRESGRWGESSGGASGQSEAVRVAVLDGPQQYSVDLKDEESRGGHTLRDHIGKADSELVDIVNRSVIRFPVFSFFKKSESSFDSLESANNFVNRLLEADQAKVDAVASGASSRAWLEQRFGYPTGKEAFRPDPEAAPYIRPTFNAGTTIVHDPRSPRGYRILTAYPTNDGTR